MKDVPWSACSYTKTLSLQKRHQVTKGPILLTATRPSRVRGKHSFVPGRVASKQRGQGAKRSRRASQRSKGSKKTRRDSEDSELHLTCRSCSNTFSSLFLLFSFCLSFGHHTVEMDANDDVCALCGEHGELICCDGCPRVRPRRVARSLLSLGFSGIRQPFALRRVVFAVSLLCLAAVSFG